MMTKVLCRNLQFLEHITVSVGKPVLDNAGEKQSLKLGRRRGDGLGWNGRRETVWWYSTLCRMLPLIMQWCHA